MIPFKQIVALLLISIPLLAVAQKAIPDQEKDAVIDQIQVLIDSNYVFMDQVDYVNHALDSLNRTGKYDDITDYQAFAKALTEDLVGITNDKHFVVAYNPELIKSRRARRERMHETQESEAEEAEETIDWNQWYAMKENFGFEKIEILAGNIGYIKFTFWQPLAWVQPTIDATMGFVANTDALIIDLTSNQGGYSPTDSYLGSFFFGEDPFLWMSSYNRPTEETSVDSTFQQIGGARYLNKPVLILVSDQTFSLAEQFAYSMKHFDRAKIVGQVTAGAAHAIDFLEVNDNFGVQVPVQYSIHPVTQTDWEGTGVTPDIITSKEEALKAAHLDALDRLIETAEYDNQIKKYKEIKQELNKF